MLEKLAEIGIVPGQKFDLLTFSELDQKVLKTVPKLAKVEMGFDLKKQPTTNGWLYFTDGVGNFGNAYITRGMACFLGPGWNRPHDAIYPLSFKDADGNKYDGSKNNYVIRFEKAGTIRRRVGFRCLVFGRLRLGQDDSSALYAWKTFGSGNLKSQI